MMCLEPQEILKELSKFHMLRVKLTFFFKGNQPCMTRICYISHTPNQGYLDIQEFVHPQAPLHPVLRQTLPRQGNYPIMGKVASRYLLVSPQMRKHTIMDTLAPRYLSDSCYSRYEPKHDYPGMKHPNTSTFVSFNLSKFSQIRKKANHRYPYIQVLDRLFLGKANT